MGVGDSPSQSKELLIYPLTCHLCPILPSPWIPQPRMDGGRGQELEPRGPSSASGPEHILSHGRARSPPAPGSSDSRGFLSSHTPCCPRAKGQAPAELRWGQELLPTPHPPPGALGTLNFRRRRVRWRAGKKGCEGRCEERWPEVRCTSILG